MKNIIFLFLFLVSLNGHAQNKQSNDSLNKIELLQYKIDNLKIRLDDYIQHNKDLTDAKRDEIEKLMEQKESALDSRMLIYVSIFVAAFLLVIGFFRWLGKSEIRRIVNEQAVKQIDEQLKIKLSDKVIDDKLTLLGKPIIEQILGEISTSKKKAKESADALEESSKKYQQLLNELSIKSTGLDPTKSTPEDKAKVQEFNKVLEIVKDEKDFTEKDWYLKGSQAYSNAKYEQAIKYFNKSIEINPTPQDENVFYYRGLSKYRLRKFDEALVDFNESKNYGEKWHIYFIRATTYEMLNRYSEALEDIEKALAITPKDIDAIKIKDNILKKMKKN